MTADEDDILRLAAGDREALFLLGCNILEGSVYEYPITDAERFAKADGFARLAVKSAVTQPRLSKVRFSSDSGLFVAAT